MSRFDKRFLAIVFPAFFAAAAPANAALTQLWQVGIDNNTQSDFVQENGSSNAAPGSATARDDDWYFAGAYGGSIGTLLTNERTTDDLSTGVVEGFERALTNGDPRNRIHFILTADQIDDNFQLQADIVASTFSGGTGSGNIPFRMLFNGNVVFPTVNLTTNGLLTSPVFSGLAVGAVAGENVVTLERDAGGNWMQFDFVRLNSEVVLLPEPATAALGLMGMAGLVLRRRRLG